MGAPIRIQMVNQADHFFGVPDVQILQVTETYDGIHCVARLLPGSERPACRACDDDRPPRVQDYTTLRVSDTPSRGRQTTIDLDVPRYRHRCGATIDARRPSFLHRDLPATKRLVRYVEGETFRRPVLDISQEVGLPEADVRKLAKRLAHRLRTFHRFPTPEVLALDDLRIRRKLFTVVTDGVTGRAIALVEGLTYEAIRDELVRRQVDVSAVRCVVSDMGSSNNKVVKHYFAGTGVVHVADKWHILRYVQKALARVISKEIDRREKPPKGTPANEAEAMKAQAATIREARPQLMGARLKRPDEPQGALKLDKLGPVLALSQPISAAFWAKIRLHKAYAAPSRADAVKLGLRFARRAYHPDIREAMLPALKHIYRYRKQVLAYWSARWPDGSLIKPTTGPTERRNGSIRKIWRSAHGFRRHELFELRVLYEPWRLDVDIVPCAAARCYAVEGPSNHLKQRRFASVQDPDDLRCSAHL